MKPEDETLISQALSAHRERDVHIGPNGAGQVAKACNQMIMVAAIEAAAEAMRLAAAAGVDCAKVRQALSGGSAASRVLDVMGERMVRRDFSAGIEARLHHKDFGLVLEAARQSGVPVPLAAAVAQQLNALMAQGWGRDDTSSLLREERFHVVGTRPIAFLLGGYARTNDQFSVSFGGEEMMLTTLLIAQPDRNLLVFDCSGSADINRRFLQSSHNVFAGRPGGIHVQFTTGRASEMIYGGSKAFSVALPKHVVRLQRRDTFRIETPRGKPLQFFGRLASGKLLNFPAHDISVPCPMAWHRETGWTIAISPCPKTSTSCSSARWSAM